MSHSLKYFYFLCQCSFKYLTEFYTPKLSIGIRERGTGTLVFEGIAERCDLISHLQAIRPEWEKRTGLLKKPQPSQPRGSSRSLRSGQVPTRQTHVCKTSIGRKMLRLQRHLVVATGLEGVVGAGAGRQTSAHRLGCCVPSKEGPTG